MNRVEGDQRAILTWCTHEAAFWNTVVVMPVAHCFRFLHIDYFDEDSKANWMSISRLNMAK
jgi:hypothetical protein